MQFYLTSLKSDASIVGQGIRLHWGIENQAHWTLDVTFDEDKSRIRSGHSPRNFAFLEDLPLICYPVNVLINVVFDKKVRELLWITTI